MHAVTSDRQDRLYDEASAAYAPAIARLARASEADPDRARDLEQDMHLALWRSFARFDGRCATGTWLYRVVHNVAADHVARWARAPKLVAIEDIDPAADIDTESAIGDAQLIGRIRALIARLKPADRTIILLYLEGLDATEIGDVTGLTPNHVGVKIHRIKALLARHFRSGDPA